MPLDIVAELGTRQLRNMFVAIVIELRHVHCCYVSDKSIVISAKLGTCPLSIVIVAVLVSCQ